MTWIPLGPTFVLAPRYQDYTRMARANLYGAQCAVLGIAVSPADERNIVVVTRRVGGSSAFRTVNDGHSWSAIADGLTRANPQLDLACAAIHPALANVVYLGARDGRRVFVSPDGGQTWPQQRDPGGKVTQLIVDRNSSGDWHAATLYAATDAGVAHSIDGGDTWSMAAIGEVTSLAVYMPVSGTRRFYAGVYGRGLFYAESPAGPWTNLFGTAVGLPPAPASGAAPIVVLVDYCPRQPDRVYALVSTLANDHLGPGAPHLYVSVAAPPSGAWEERGAGLQPPLDYGLEGLAFMVAPEPFGADTGDVLFCSAGVYFQRSIDGGRTWQISYGGNILHTDTRSLSHHPPKTAYYPDALASGAIAPRARVYVGNDGGLGASRGYSNPSFTFGSLITGEFNSGATYNTSLGIVEGLNHGLASLAAHQFASNPDPLGGGPMSMLGYVTTLDTGTHRHLGSTVWRNLDGGDAGPIAVAPTTNGVRAWLNASENIIWPTWNFITWVDRDGCEEWQHVITADASSSGATSNMAPGGGETVYVGIIALEQVTTLFSPVTSHSADVEVIPVTMTPDLIVGARVGLGDPEPVVYQAISSVSSDRFHCLIQGSHTYPAGTAVRVVRSYVARVTGNTAARISQIFIPQIRRIYRLAKSGDVLLGASADQRLWTASSVSTATDTTVWTEITGRPTELSTVLGGPDNLSGAGEYVSGVELQRLNPLISDIVADASGVFYVMLSGPVTATPPGGGTIATTLFRIAGGAWVAEACTLPSTATIPQGVALGRVVAHPTQPGRLFVTRNERVFQLDRGMTSWTWTELTDNLPGQEIHDLWIGNIAAVGATPRLVLRATTAVRGVWEMEIDAPAISGAHFYFRDHSFDPGWTRPSTDGVLNPLRAGQRHWHWQSADIKVDTPLRDSTGALYYQNDPEAPSPTADDFGWFKDRSQTAAAGTTARIWVRVNNRSTLASGEVSVWAITCQFSGALPALPAMFWSRFHGDGTLDSTSALSADWTSLGVRTVSGVHAEAPGIVEFEMPTGAAGDHRCVVVFVHGPGAALITTGLSLVIDEVVPAHNQIAQRNVLVGPPLPPSPSTPPPPSQGGDTGVGGTLAREIYVEFNNPWPEYRRMTVSFDLTNLPPAIGLRFRLSRNAQPEAITGAKPRPLGCLALPLQLLRKSENESGDGSSKTKRLDLASAVYVPDGAGEIELRDMPVAAGGKIAAQLELRHEGQLEPGAEYHLDLIQSIKREVVGGATIVLPVSKAKPAGEDEKIDWEVEREIGSRIATGRRLS